MCLKEFQMKSTARYLMLLMALLLLNGQVIPAAAESLFRTGIAYQTSQSYTPRSLFAMSRPATVGDMVTIQINEISTTNFQNTFSFTKEQDINENGSKVINNIVRKVIGISQLLPSVEGLKNTNQHNIAAKNQKTITFRDKITCQVIQVLPNGNFIVQGRKTVFANKEEQDLMVTGIVNPYYLDVNNSIASERVGNFQMNAVNRGIMSRPYTDGLIGKYLRFVN
jgi:flagellar L-ring protein precursor FlgH